MEILDITFYPSFTKRKFVRSRSDRRAGGVAAPKAFGSDGIAGLSGNVRADE